MKHLFKPFLILGLLLFTFNVDAQRRQRPGAVKNTDEFLDQAFALTPVTFKYIKGSNSFRSDVYYYAEGGGARMKVGTATLSMTGNQYNLVFKSAKVATRKAMTSEDHRKSYFNPWIQSNLANDFTQKGKFETFKTQGKYYLRLYDGNSDNYIADIPIKDPNQKDFTLNDGEGLVFEFIHQ